MIERTGSRKYTVADLYKEAGNLVREEMGAMKNKPLSPAEETKSDELAKLISKMVLKEMKIA